LVITARCSGVYRDMESVGLFGTCNKERGEGQRGWGKGVCEGNEGWVEGRRGEGGGRRGGWKEEGMSGRRKG
jgi:hypothetical protein